MIKCCRYCKFSYFKDLDDVSGFSCQKYPPLKITNPDTIHSFCHGFIFSLLKFLLGGYDENFF